MDLLSVTLHFIPPKYEKVASLVWQSDKLKEQYFMWQIRVQDFIRQPASLFTQAVSEYWQVVHSLPLFQIAVNRCPRILDQYNVVNISTFLSIVK
jgi:hypothetical protein